MLRSGGVRVPDAVQRERACASGAPLIRDRREGGVCNGPRRSDLSDLRILSADLGLAQDRCLLRTTTLRFVLRSARDTSNVRHGIKHGPDD